MLSEQELKEIEEEIGKLPTRHSGSIDALKVVQRHKGYVSDKDLIDLASVLGMSPAELDRVATFYNLIFRKPVGKHVILVCDSISCFIMGEENIFSYLISKLGIQPGQTTPDGMFTLLPTVCLGHCDEAPVMMFDWEIIGNLTPEKIDRVLADAAKQDEDTGDK